MKSASLWTLESHVAQWDVHFRNGTWKLRANEGNEVHCYHLMRTLGHTFILWNGGQKCFYVFIAFFFLFFNKHIKLILWKLIHMHITSQCLWQIILASYGSITNEGPQGGDFWYIWVWRIFTFGGLEEFMSSFTILRMFYMPDAVPGTEESEMNEEPILLSPAQKFQRVYSFFFLNAQEHYGYGP